MRSKRYIERTDPSTSVIIELNGLIEELAEVFSRSRRHRISISDLEIILGTGNKSLSRGLSMRVSNLAAKFHERGIAKMIIERNITNTKEAAALREFGIRFSNLAKLLNESAPPMAFEENSNIAENMAEEFPDRISPASFDNIRRQWDYLKYAKPLHSVSARIGARFLIGALYRDEVSAAAIEADYLLQIIRHFPTTQEYRLAIADGLHAISHIGRHRRGFPGKRVEEYAMRAYTMYEGLGKDRDKLTVLLQVVKSDAYRSMTEGFGGKLFKSVQEKLEYINKEAKKKRNEQSFDSIRLYAKQVECEVLAAAACYNRENNSALARQYVTLTEECWGQILAFPDRGRILDQMHHTQLSSKDLIASFCYHIARGEVGEASNVLEGFTKGPTSFFRNRLNRAQAAIHYLEQREYCASAELLLRSSVEKVCI